MKQALTNIIRNQCKFLTPEAKAKMTVFVFHAQSGTSDLGRPLIPTGTQFCSSLETAEQAFVFDKLPGGIYSVHKDEKIFEAKTYGDHLSLLVVAMED